MSIINSVKRNNTTYKVASSATFTCSTASATAAKTISGLDTTEITNGLTINVLFEHTNTVNNPTLNGYVLYKYGTTPVGNTVGSSWQDGEIIPITFVTSGNTFVCLLNKGNWEVSLPKHLHIIRIFSDDSTSGYDITFAVWLTKATPYTDNAIDTMILAIANEYNASESDKYCLVSAGGYRKTSSTTLASITSGYVSMYEFDGDWYSILTFKGAEYTASKLIEYTTNFREEDNPTVTSISDIVVM